MRSKDKEKKDKIEEKAPLGVQFGSFLRVIINILKFFLKLLFKIIMTLGLLPAIIYCIFGLILYFGFSFSPFDSSLNAKLYLAGFSLTIACAIIISGKNLVVKPFKNVASGYKNPVWKRGKVKKVDEEDEEEEYIPAHKPQREVRKKPQKENKKRFKEELEERKMVYSDDSDNEQPKVYNSAVDPNIVIHEYHDCFVVYRRVGNRLIKDKIEFKDYE